MPVVTRSAKRRSLENPTKPSTCISVPVSETVHSTSLKDVDLGLRSADGLTRAMAAYGLFNAARAEYSAAAVDNDFNGCKRAYDSLHLKFVSLTSSFVSA